MGALINALKALKNNITQKKTDIFTTIEKHHSVTNKGLGNADEEIQKIIDDLNVKKAELQTLQGDSAETIRNLQAKVSTLTTERNNYKEQLNSKTTDLERHQQNIVDLVSKFIDNGCDGMFSNGNTKYMAATNIYSISNYFDSYINKVAKYKFPANKAWEELVYPSIGFDFSDRSLYVINTGYSIIRLARENSYTSRGTIYIAREPSYPNNRNYAQSHDFSTIDSLPEY